ncbi:MAG: tRNA-dihydrouridine synthase [Patescibacteria group bacterium]
MNKNFYQKLKKPIYALAPLAGITDSAFRQICKEDGADIVYSEMASATALFYNQEKTLELLKFDKKERPYVVQLFGSNPEHFAQAVKIVEKKIKPDGIDINFGCPVQKVIKQKAGAELFKDLKLSRAVIESVIKNTSLPVSIKTRAGVGNVDILKFLKYMKGLDIKAIMIHGRTFSQGFSGPVDFEIIKKTRKYFSGIIIANGGVIDKKSADELLIKSKADGIGVGQGALGRPWIFSNLKDGNEKIKTKKEIFRIALNHAKLMKKLKGKQGIVEMRKHLCWYVQGLPDARKLREKLVKVENLKEIKNILSK